eukprot:CAMPEP_0117425630 /NCGR_PEP_ID=MMETSP0758-20121206/5876_1 /TAXON_ID=63605 /ORGANISM="Percolomonas cosmopolitus, Strain AE-1 (ATCC 50343)" /LENGTH=130 /DNA_ID=CAMNT_0005210255 /DNA_START=839 /DNA_END=1228 /DNA_ORIENTATION=-
MSKGLTNKEKAENEFSKILEGATNEIISIERPKRMSNSQRFSQERHSSLGDQSNSQNQILDMSMLDSPKTLLTPQMSSPLLTSLSSGVQKPLLSLSLSNDPFQDSKNDHTLWDPHLQLSQSFAGENDSFY